MIIIDSCVVKSWFTAERVSQIVEAKNMHFILYFVFEWPVPAYIIAHWRYIACLPTGRINTHRDT